MTFDFSPAASFDDAQENQARYRAGETAAGRHESNEERTRTLFEFPGGCRDSAVERQDLFRL